MERTAHLRPPSRSRSRHRSPQHSLGPIGTGLSSQRRRTQSTRRAVSFRRRHLSPFFPPSFKTTPTLSCALRLSSPRLRAFASCLNARGSRRPQFARRLPRCPTIRHRTPCAGGEVGTGAKRVPAALSALAGPLFSHVPVIGSRRCPRSRPTCSRARSRTRLYDAQDGATFPPQAHSRRRARTRSRRGSDA